MASRGPAASIVEVYYESTFWRSQKKLEKVEQDFIDATWLNEMNKAGKLKTIGV